MLNICEAQKDFIRQSITHNIRVDGRTNSCTRSPIVRTQVIAHLPGSSYVFMEYENVEIYTGVKVKIEKVAAMTPCNQIALELTCMRKLRDEENQEMLRMQSILQERLVRVLANSKEASEFLHIRNSRQHKLYMYIDVFFLSSPHISQLNMAITGIKSALTATSIAEIEVSFNEVTEEETTEINKTMRTFSKSDWDEVSILGLVCRGTEEYFVEDLRKQQYESVDACFLAVASGDKLVFLESLKGSASVDNINRCARYVAKRVQK